MQIEQPKILKTLEDALLAHKAGDFVNALQFYEYFFDHALDDDPYALYGVRLSYCLEGWAELGQIFPGAKSRLEQKQHTLVEEYQKTKNRETFHDYYCICKALDQLNQALDMFSQLYYENPKSAQKLAKYVWDDLINAEEWELCSHLLTQPEQKIEELFAVYDEAQNLKQIEPDFDNIKFDQHLLDTLLNSVMSVVKILRFNSRSKEIPKVERQFYQAVESRNNASLTKTVHAKASYLFIGH